MSDEFKLSTGRVVRANRGLVGISLTLDDEPLSEGYDGHIYTIDKWTMEQDELWTQAERLELATLVIARWVWWVENGTR